jgi:hypothetical protein
LTIPPAVAEAKKDITLISMHEDFIKGVNE